MAKKRAGSTNGKKQKKARRCEGKDCAKQSSFGPVGGPRTSARFCKTHVPKEEGVNWEDVVNKKCEAPDCAVRPSYGPVGGEKSSARFCRTHAPDSENWENVVSQRCEALGCKTKPQFGPVGGKYSSARFCRTHTPDLGNWEDVVNKRCEATGCKIQPSYGPVGEGMSSARFCRTHVPDSENWEDVAHKRCEAPDCAVRPSFGPVGGVKSSARFCRRHVPDSENWEDVVHKRCEAPDCKTGPSYGPVGGGISSARFCQTHTPDLENWEDVRNKRCAQEGCSTSARTGYYREYCLPCFANLFPLESVSRNYKTKERLVVQAVDKCLKRDFAHLEVTYDKQVVGGCSKRRPDIAVDVLTHVIIVECDEDGHNTDDYCTCENKRMMQLFNDYGNRPFVLIRFNPDAYANSHGSKVASCFARTKTGSVKLAKEEMWNERLRVLRERLQVHLSNIPERELTVEHLYYDGFH